MKNLLIVTFLLLNFSLFAQKPFKIAGKVVFSDQQPIESATIHLEKSQDSTIVTYTISDEKGNFELKGKSFDKNLRMVVSFVGMKTYKKQIPVAQLANFNAGTITLEELELLDEVYVTSNAPITVKKDTLEFNVESFKTKKDATVEDLLKKLPGVEIDEEGKITVNGKPVNKILVNGKPFFGDDPSITTKNLTKEIIEKVQITDTKTKSQAFTGEKGDANNKTINLTIKKENNKGWFGRVAAGGGTDKRYEGAALVNRFNDKLRISALGGTNNINSPGFSFGEIRKMFGGGGGMSFNDNGSFSINGMNFGGNGGIVTSRTAGITFANEFKKGIDMNADYFHSGANSFDVSSRNREYTLTDRHYFTNSESKSTGTNNNHRAGMDFDLEITPNLLVNISPQFTFNKRNGDFKSYETTLDENKKITNKYDADTKTTSEAKNFNNRLEITQKLDTAGSFLKASLTNKFDVSDSEGFNNSTIEILGDAPTKQERKQLIKGDNQQNDLTGRLGGQYAIVPKKFFLTASYQYKSSKQKNERNTYDFDNSTNKYADLNEILSSNFTYQDIANTPSLGFSYETKKMRLNFAADYIFRTLKSEDKLRPQASLSRNFNAMVFDAGFRYRFKSKARIYINYDLSNQVPTINQMQPFTDVSNPSNIVTGNPNLSPSNRHNLFMNFSKFNWQKKTGLYFYGGGDYTHNSIVSNIKIDENFIRRMTYVNSGNTYSLWGGGSYRYKVKLSKLSSVNLRAGMNINRRKNINIFNDVENPNITQSITPNVGITFDWNEKINIESRYRLGFSDSKFKENKRQNRSFTTHRVNIKTTANLFKKLEWINDIRYNYNPNLIGFSKSSWFWNATLSYSILKEKANITFKVYDLLNQNTNARRSVTSNYIEDAESTVLQQYFMLGFSWKFNTLGAKGKTGDRMYIMH